MDMPAALSLCHHYSNLSYFPHALEILLHHVLDDAVDAQVDSSSDQARSSILPSVISFLQASLPAQAYLDIIVQCTRKTELRSWRTLFAHLPHPRDLFEQALRFKSLKTAAGYLLVLQAFDEEEEPVASDGGDSQIEDYTTRLLALAAQKLDWDLCAELARFLIALDGSGELLRRMIARVGLQRGSEERDEAGDRASRGLGLTLPIPSSSSHSSLSASPLPSPSRANPPDFQSNPQHLQRSQSNLSNGTSASITTTETKEPSPSLEG
jgi:RAB6A-GEF complex partner protein 1